MSLSDPRDRKTESFSVSEQFPLTSLWRAASARFMPPVPEVQLPGELIARFTGPAHEALMRLLVWLSPLTARSGLPCAIKLHEGR